MPELIRDMRTSGFRMGDSFEPMTHQALPPGIEVYEIGTRRLYVKTGARNFAISEDDLTPQELVGIAGDIVAHQAKRAASSE